MSSWARASHHRKRHYGVGTLSHQSKKRRLILISCIALAWVSGLVFRLFSVQVVNVSQWRSWAQRQHSQKIQLSSERGPIMDRNGELLAVSVPVGSVYVRPKQVTDKQKVLELSELLDLPRKEIEKKLSQKKPFVWLKRQIPRAQAEEVLSHKVPGIDYVIETKRYYPYGQAAGVLVGKVSIDGNGLSGLEALYDKHLRGKELITQVGRDALGNKIQPVGLDPVSFELPKGESLNLTIDAGAQLALDQELEAGRIAARAKRAVALMIDAESGEVLGMSQAPSLNLNDERLTSPTSLINHVVELTFEPGSIMKPLVVAATLDQGLIKPHQIFNCENGRYRVGPHTIKDVHPYGMLDVRDIVVRSSNIGMSKIGAIMGKERLYRSLQNFGFGRDPGLGLVGESGGILRRPDSWAVVDVATHSFGQGMAVTPLQIARAVAAIANGGKLPTLHLRTDDVVESKRILSEPAANMVRSMMRDVVTDEHGTGKQALIEGIFTAGKTGTAQKTAQGKRGYEPGAYVASFAGFADLEMNNEKRSVVLFVAIDEPRGGSIYGGTLAAPVFRKIIERVADLWSTRHELSITPVESDPLSDLRTV